MKYNRSFNFSAGPAMMPEPVLEAGAGLEPWLGRIPEPAELLRVLGTARPSRADGSGPGATTPQ